jgi:hypothetical protein
MSRLVESVGSVVSVSSSKDTFTLSSAGRHKIDFVPSLTITNNNAFGVSVDVTGRINLVGSVSSLTKQLASVTQTCTVPSGGSLDVSIDGLTISKTFQTGSDIKFAVLKTAGVRTTGAAMGSPLSGSEITNVVVSVVADLPGTDDYGDDTYMSIQKI